MTKPSPVASKFRSNTGEKRGGGTPLAEALGSKDTGNATELFFPGDVEQLDHWCAVRVFTQELMQRKDGTINNSSFTEAPNVNSIWLLQSSTLEAQTFRVIAVEEQDGINYAITALKYNYNYVTKQSPKYTAIDSMQGITLPDRNISISCSIQV